MNGVGDAANVRPIEAPQLPPSADQPGPIPKSAYRWAIILLCFLIMVTSFTVRVAWASAATHVSGELSLNATMLGSFVTAFYVGYVFTNALSGFAADRMGAKNVMCLALTPLACLSARSVSSVRYGRGSQFSAAWASWQG